MVATAKTREVEEYLPWWMLMLSARWTQAGGFMVFYTPQPTKVPCLCVLK